MATFKAVVQHPKREGKQPVYIRVINNRSIGHINTGWYVTTNDFDGEHFKDRRLEIMVNEKIEEYEKRIKVHFGACSTVNGTEMAEYLTNTVTGVDFIKFYEGVINQMISDGRENSASNYQVSLNHLKRFIGVESVLSIDKVTVNFLRRFEDDLYRECQKKGFTGKRCVSLALSNIRAVFNLAIKKYNDEENKIIVISHYPFSSIKVKSPKSTKIRAVDASVFREILQSDKIENKRDELARDYLLLSLGLGAINGVDLYYMKPENYVRGKLNYDRRKTTSTRDDNGYMSITVPDEVKPLFEKYADSTGERLLNFYLRYSCNKNFIKAVNKGFKHICSLLDLPEVTTYTIRHTFANVANDELCLSIGDVALVLNHVSGFKTTEIYTGRIFRKIDAILRMVLDWILYEEYNPIVPQKIKTKSRKNKKAVNLAKA